MVDVEDIVVGSGMEAQEGLVHTVHYVGRLESTGEVFLSTCEAGEMPLSFVLGDPALIEGWNRGLLADADGELMREEGIRRLVVPPPLAWGRRGAGCDEDGENCVVPADATVIFTIQLLEVRPPDVPSTVPNDVACAEPLVAASQAL